VSELGALLDRLAADSEWERHRALQALRSAGAPADLIRAMIHAFDSDDPALRSGARAALAALAHPDSPAREVTRELLVGALRADSHDVRILAASAMGEAGDPELVGPLLTALDDRDPNVVAAAADALGEIADPASLGRLCDLATHDSPWVRAAAVVALGRLRDARALPALERAAESPGLEAAVAEAVRRIDEPAGLPLLERLIASAPQEALVAAGSILSSTPDAIPPAWVAEAARAQEDALTGLLVEEDDPAVARLLGLAATDSAVETLLILGGPPRRSEAAVAGILAVPDAHRAGPILDRLARAEPDEIVDLLGLLPALDDQDRLDRIVPLLAHPDGSVRGAAAAALARAPLPRALPTLSRTLAEGPARPEIVRAIGGLGPAACAALAPLLRDDAAPVRGAAAEALARCADAGVEPDLRAALAREADPGARRSMLRALAAVAREAAVPTLVHALAGADPETRTVIIEALGSTAAPTAIAPLGDLLDGPRHERLAAILALGDLEDPAVADILQPLLRSPDRDVRRHAVRAVLPIAEVLAPETAADLSTDEDPRIREWAVRILATRDDRAALEAIASSDRDASVRSVAQRALDPGSR
jgi:HEAT repeat protein